MWSIIKKIIKCIYIFLSVIASFIFISFTIFNVLSFRHIDPKEILILLYVNTILIVQLFLFIPQKWFSKIQNKINNYLKKRKTKQYKNKETATENTIQFNPQIDNQPTMTEKSSKKKSGRFLFTIFIFLNFLFFVIYCIYSCYTYLNTGDAAKPIIYLYPTEKTKITVTVGNPQNLTHTYPKYETGWTVTAEPNGNLTDPKTNKHYYALYWEGKNTIEPNFKEGFVVKGKDTSPFLEEKLAQLGLNERESNEFIIYWLPKLESSPYNFIRFQTLEEQNQNMPLEVTPQPDTMIRVMMEFKNLVTPIIVKEQLLPPTPKRTGFTLIEWGGTDVTDNILR